MANPLSLSEQDICKRFTTSSHWSGPSKTDSFKDVLASIDENIGVGTEHVSWTVCHE